MKLDQTQGDKSEIEAVLTWWQAMRAKTSNGASDYEFNTSVNLFKKSAAISQRDRQDFAECIKRAGVSVSTTVSDRSGTGRGAGGEAWERGERILGRIL